MARSLLASALAVLGFLVFLTAPFITACYAEWWARPFIAGCFIHAGLTLLALGVHAFELYRHGYRLLQITLIAVDFLMASISSLIVFALFFSATPYLLILLFGVAEVRKRFC